MVDFDIDAIPLTTGSHRSPTEGACIMEAVSYVAGEPWSDTPECASPVIAAFLRSWNDSLDDEPRQDLKRYIVRLVGSKGTTVQEEVRSWMALDWLVRVHTPAWLRLAGLDVQADSLAGMPALRPDTCPSLLPAIRAVRSDAAAAGAAAWDAAGAAAGAAVGAAAWDAAWDAWAAAGDAAGAAAWAAAWAAGAAAWDAAGAAAGAAAGDAARAALAPTVAVLQPSAHDLVDAMLAVTEEAAS